MQDKNNKKKKKALSFVCIVSNLIASLPHGRMKTKYDIGVKIAITVKLFFIVGRGVICQRPEPS